MNSETRNCANCKKDFTIEPQDFAFYTKINVPPPTFCPDCRFQRRIAYRNQNKLFKVKNHFTGKTIFSLYPEGSGRKVVTQDEWVSDSWDPMEYGRDFDATKPFMPQVLELDRDVPIYALNAQRMVNSDYSGNATGLKNCYLIFNSNWSEDCLYGDAIDGSADCVDNSYAFKCRSCYGCFWVHNCYQCRFSVECVDCRDVWFSKNCVGCSDCIGCVNLRNESYCIFNKKYSKEEYASEVERLNLKSGNSLRRIQEEAMELWKKFPMKYEQGIKNTNVTGVYVSNSKNVSDSYFIREGEDLRYCQYLQAPKSKDCYDVTIWGENPELCYETCICGENPYGVKFSWDCWPNNRNCEYSTHLNNCKDCFGCVCLKNKQYCVLNKQYTKEEYEALVSKIKEQMDAMPYVDSRRIVYKYGEFFPAELAPFGYNNTLAQDHFPLTKEEVEKLGYGWIEVEKGEYAPTIVGGDLPDTILEVNDSILKDVIKCATCGFSYKIHPNELLFLQKSFLPLSRECVDCRRSVRFIHKLKHHLVKRTCSCAGKSSGNKKYDNTASHAHGDGACTSKFVTAYADPDSIVYCEACYQQEVI